MGQPTLGKIKMLTPIFFKIKSCWPLSLQIILKMKSRPKSVTKAC